MTTEPTGSIISNNAAAATASCSSRTATPSSSSPSPSPPSSPNGGPSNPVSFVEHSGMRFLIFDAPNDENLPKYMDEWKKHNVRNVVRVCEPTYEKETVERSGITVHEMAFQDGTAPPEEILTSWLRLVERVFPKGSKKPSDETIGLHCVAGLGRAPLLVAIALMNRGTSALQAVDFIRSKRRGAINVTQFKFLKAYKPRSNGGCRIM